MQPSLPWHSHPCLCPTLVSADRWSADGLWRSLVARVLWEHDVAGSNPVSPTT